jgi:hypothetical protein
MAVNDYFTKVLLIQKQVVPNNAGLAPVMESRRRDMQYSLLLRIFALQHILIFCTGSLSRLPVVISFLLTQACDPVILRSDSVEAAYVPSLR